MSTLAEMKQNPFWRIAVGAWEGCGVTDADLPDPLPAPPPLPTLQNPEPDYDPQTWLAENFPKVYEKVRAAAEAALTEGYPHA